MLELNSVFQYVFPSILYIYHSLEDFDGIFRCIFTFVLLFNMLYSNSDLLQIFLLHNLFSYLSSNCYSYALELIAAQNKMRLQFYEYSRLQCIKMAIWPLLYIKGSWFKSNISAQVYSITYIVYATVYYLLYSQVKMNAFYQTL